MLIQPPYFRETRGLNSVIPSLGLSYLSASLQNFGFSCHILDLEASRLEFYQGFWKSWNQHHFLKQVQQYYPRSHCIGIGPVLTLYFPQACFLAQLLKKHFPLCKILMGGPHFPKTPQDGYPRFSDLEQYSEIDFIFSGYSEFSLPKFLQQWQNQVPLENIPGLLFRSASQIQAGPPPENIFDLDGLPFPDRSWYLKHPQLFKRYFASPKRYLGKRAVPILASRGCPYGCIFCSSAKTVRKIRTPANIVAEIERVYETHQVTRFIFFDDLFVGRTESEKQRMIQFCQLIQEKKLPITWEIDLRADVCHYLGIETLRQMQQSGLRIVNLGLERADSESLKALEKHLTLVDIEKAVSLLRQVGGISICGTFILGGTQQTVQEVRDTIRFSIALGLDYASFNPLVIHTNRLDRQTPLQYRYALGSRIMVTSSELSGKEVQQLIALAYRKFYFRLARVLLRMKSIRSWGDATHLVQEYFYYLRHL